MELNEKVNRGVNKSVNKGPRGISIGDHKGLKRSTARQQWVNRRVQRGSRGVSRVFKRGVNRGQQEVNRGSISG